MKNNTWKHKGAEIKEPLHYTACGLEDVYLLSGYDKVETPHGIGLSIKNLDGLHKAIGCYLVMQKKTLNGKEIRFLRKHLDLTQSELGKLVGVTSQQVARWEKDQSPISGAAEALVRVLFLEQFKNKTIKVRDILESLEEKDDTLHKKQEFINTTQGWQPKVAA